jgi:hypothetical protein
VATPKTPKEIETLLRWAYRDELPKQAVGGLSQWEQAAFLGTVIDDNSRNECPLPANLGPPHPDALQIDHAVNSLEDVVIKPGAAQMLLGHLFPWLGEDEPLLTQGMKAQTSALVTAYARMGTRPIWKLDYDFIPMRDMRSRKVRVFGLTAGGRYAEGAHCKLAMDPLASEILSARFEYFVWHSALTELARTLVFLEDYEPRPPSAPQLPWVHGEPMAKVFVEPNPFVKNDKLPLKPVRPRLLPPISSPIEDQDRRQRMARKPKPVLPVVNGESGGAP